MNSLTFILVGLLLGEVARDVKCLTHGQDATEGQFKYMTFIQITTGDCTERCGGAIINSNHILTAAHCMISIVPSQILIAVGVVDLKGTPEQVLEVQKIKMHPDYVPLEQDHSLKHWMVDKFKRATHSQDQTLPGVHDIAVLRLKTEIHMGGIIQPIPLPPADAPVPYSGPCVFSGWGRIVNEEGGAMPHILQWSPMTILKSSDCTELGSPHDKTEFCATHADGNNYVHLLSGDSGGPFVCNDQVFGVLSTSRAKMPISVLSKVSDHVKFIKKAAKM